MPPQVIGTTMHRTVPAGLMFLALTSPAIAQTRIDAISTNFHWLGPNDKIVVDRYDDPKVPNVSCYMSRAETGGVKGGVGNSGQPGTAGQGGQPGSTGDYGLCAFETVTN